MNLGAFAGGAVQGFDTAESWKDKAAKRQRDTYIFQSQKDAQDALNAADAAWARAAASMNPSAGVGGAPNGPTPQPPMPGQPSQPMSPPPSPQQGQMPIGPHSFVNQLGLAQGVSMPQGVQQGPPPQIGQNVQPPQGTPPIPQQAMHPPQVPPQQYNPLAPQPYRGPSQAAPPPTQGAPQQGSPMPLAPQGMQPGNLDLNTVTQQVLRANPDLDINKPRDAMIIARAVGNALPYMKQDDVQQYHMLMNDLRQQKQDTQEDQGNRRVDIAQQRADQGWQRIQQASQRLMDSAKSKQDNLALNMQRLEVAKKNGDTQRQRLIMDQIKNDRAARDQTVNSISNLLRSASPSQMNDPVYKADMDALQAQLKELQQEPASLQEEGNKEKSKRSEDAASPKSTTPIAPPKPGTKEGGYTFRGGDPADPKNWTPSATDAIPLVSSRPEAQ